MNLVYNNKILSLRKKYSWLNTTTTIENYVEPQYYDRLLKDYVFLEKTDLQLFKEYIETIPKKNCLDALELGCGSGRVTNVFLNHFRDCNLKMVDLSDQMLKFCQKRFKNRKKIEFIRSDSVKFLEKSNKMYDIIFSLWSFSHSTHQILTRDGLNNGRKYIQNVIQKMIEKNMKKGSSFFLIHFDSMSDEQKILMQQWKKVYPIYNNINKQSPSKLLIDEVLQSLEKQSLINLETKHYKGHEITYSSVEEALEIFLNFHMESYFNKSSLLQEVIDELVSYFKNFTDKNGMIKIKPGCFIYKIEKL